MNKKHFFIREILTKCVDSNQFFKDYFEYKVENSNSLSLRQWSQRLGYSNPSYISDVIRGKRRSNCDLVDRFKRIQPLSLMEEVYLQNLQIIESSNTLDLMERKREENKLISEFWTHHSQPIPIESSPIDVFLCAQLMIPNKKMNTADLAKSLAPFLEPSQVFERLEVLRGGGILTLAEDGFLEMKELRLFPKSKRAIERMLPLLQKLENEGKAVKKHTVLALNLTPEGCLRAESIFIHAMEKIVLIAMEEEKNPETPKEIYGVHGALFQVSGLNSRPGLEQ